MYINGRNFVIYIYIYYYTNNYIAYLPYIYIEINIGTIVIKRVLLLVIRFPAAETFLPNASDSLFSSARTGCGEDGDGNGSVPTRGRNVPAVPTLSSDYTLHEPGRF